MQSPKNPYFFDLPVSDISRSVCDALRILYHGSLDGIFGLKMNERVDLDQIHAIKIPVCHHSTKPLSDLYEYNLVLYDQSIADPLWNFEDREKQAELRALTRRVSFNTEKSNLARRILDNLFIKSDHPVYFARYEVVTPNDNYVPLHYHRQLSEGFEAYIMRTCRDFPLVRSLCRAQGLHLAKRKFAREMSSSSFRPIITYTLKESSMPGGPKLIPEPPQKTEIIPS